MIEQLNGESQVYFVIGDPIAQVKSPYGVTVAMQEQGINAVVIPLHVVPADLADVMDVLARVRNVAGLIVTVPHKFDAFSHCRGGSARASFLQAANVIRRAPDGSWYGDMVDGLAMVAALEAKGHALRGRKALLVGAGGAGSAIGHALLTAGVGALAVHDTDAARRDRLIQRLSALDLARVVPGSADPGAFDVVVNATPLGMRAGDPLPFDAARLAPATVVADVITVPAVTAQVAAARARGCPTVTGLDMFGQVSGLMIDFLLGR